MTSNVLRAAFLAPAIADFYLSVAVLFQIPDGAVVPSLRFAAVAFCWGLFLLLGLRRPLERAWILWPTILVIGLVGLSAVPGYSVGEVTAGRLAFTLAFCAALVALCFAGLSHAGRAEETAAT